VIPPEQTAYLAVAVIGIISGLGMLFVRPSPGEPERLDRLFPLARFYRYGPVRVAFALVCFGFALAGLGLGFGWF
jgi:hypothetical protein